jgi:DNA-binding GntR family transcriptional regulator
MAYEALRDAIAAHRFLPGERLMETELATEMGISRTPVREAMRRLEVDGYVVITPRKGSYVAGISMKDIADVFEIRTVLETLAAQKAAVRATDEDIRELKRTAEDMSRWKTHEFMEIIGADVQFHSLLYNASKNHRLIHLVQDLRGQIHRFRSNTLSAPERFQFAAEEHRKVVEAIERRDPKGAGQAIRIHMENAMKAMCEVRQYQK